MESRVVIYAPTGKDARLIAQVLERAHLEALVCAQASEVSAVLAQGAGALIVANEALSGPFTKALTAFLGEQPAWSDLPVIIMSQRSEHMADERLVDAQLGNVTLLERPVRGVTLVSAATSALRARSRQYAMREVDRRKDEFLAMLAHELRNPLAPISAASDLLKMPNLERAHIVQTSAIISRQVRHMTGLIDDLLDMSRVSRGLVTLDLAVVDAHLILTGAVEQSRPLFDARRQRLTLLPAAAAAYIHGDQKRLIQILANVLNNAAKYTAEGGEIILAMEFTPTQIVFSVSDNGIGMTASVIGRIFDMFAQAERTSDRTQGGLGIGLALVRSLVQLHGGQVAAESGGIGQGSRFVMSFPRSFPEQATPALEAAGTPAQRRHHRLLVVDDNVDAAEMLGMYLDSAGYEVQVVHSAQAALSSAENLLEVDAFLLDIGLPDMDGIELAKRIRATPAIAGAMLIAVTGYGQEADRSRTRAAGFDYHHVKPVDMEQLLVTLAALP